MRALERFFDSYGRLVFRQPFFFILVPSLLTIVSTYGFWSFHSQDDIWDIYAPLNGLSRVEEKGLSKYEFASGSHHHRMQILIGRRDEGNILEPSLLSKMSKAHHTVAENMTASNGQSEFFYKQMCGVYCNSSNAALLALMQAAIDKSVSSNPFKLSFPNAEALQKRAFVGYSLGGLTFDNKTNDVVAAKLFILHYMVDTTLPGGKLLATNFEMKLRAFFEKLDVEDSLLSYAFLSRTRELEEQREITTTSLPFLVLTVIVLTGFMLITLVRLPLRESQHFEAIVGVISPGMALWTTTGFLWWLGYPFSNILTVVPFLVITIGIDDAFLILAGWRQSTKTKNLEERMGEAVAISGASVAVTSVTDVACFGTGLFSNLPVVQLFCLYTTVALAVDFFYQMTFFTAFVGIVVRKQLGEEDGKPRTNKVSSSSSITVSSMAPFVPEKFRDLSHLELFIEILHTSFAKALIMASFIAHIALCTYLTTKVRTDFDMENLYLFDSPLTDISRRMQRFVLGEAFVVNFAVEPMPQFENETVRNSFEDFLVDLETIQNFGAGPTYTNVWTREYANAIAFWGEEEGYWSQPELLTNYREYGIDDKYLSISMKDDESFIDGFFFTITYHNLSNFLEVEDLLLVRRGIIAKHGFPVKSHHPLEKVPTESAASAPGNFVQTSVSAVVLMSVLVLLFVMQFEAILSVVVSIVSICLGVVAYLHLWNVHLDAVSLISMLMSIGFSVDYSAHVCYHYFAHCQPEESGSHEGKTDGTKSRLLSTLGGVGWPVMQSGLSTILGMFPLMFVRAYVVAVFWKTVILVGVLGMLHALVLLPVIFILTDDVKRLLRSK
ncbi:unnamed protein product [Caenorhabditis auriculariae]|uniref:SSD domain-containing protein n=1 Tax=Caenorhabditis auriculariae TaxID=2777116 RepID=A0A8S1HKI7_9PELO|nr:unnamed protein product [Caenorhabditis auriculariae]